jgi:hypothetical protein
MLMLQQLCTPRTDRVRVARTDRAAAPDDRSPPEALGHLARITTIPHVVDFAAGLPASQRLRHVAFVAGLAFGGAGIDARVGRRFVEDAYRATTRTAKRVALDLSRSRIWEEWEGCCLLRACAVLAGRLRVALTTEIREIRIEEWATSAA